MIHFQTIVDKVRQNHPGADEELLRRAYLFSARQHRGQIRKSGEPYLVHPLEVANILAELKLDPVCVATGLLHDTVEDTETTIQDIEEYFGRQTVPAPLAAYYHDLRRREAEAEMKLREIPPIDVGRYKAAATSFTPAALKKAAGG